MIADAYNLIDVLFAAGIGAVVGGIGVFLATTSVRNDAAADRAQASEDCARAEAGRVAMESARNLLPLHPAYATHTAEWRMVEREPDLVSVDPRGGEIVSVAVCICPWVDNERVPTEHCPLNGHGDPWGGKFTPAPTVEQIAERLAERMFPDLPGCGEPACRGCRQCGWENPAEAKAACCDGHGDEPCTPDSGLVPPFCCGNCPDQQPGTDLVPVDAVLVDEPPVTADDLAPIGPDRMPVLPWWAWALIAAALATLTPLLALVAIVSLLWLGWDLPGQRGALVPVGAVVMELEHPAPAPAYDGRHRAAAGRWWWSR